MYVTTYLLDIVSLSASVENGSFLKYLRKEIFFRHFQLASKCKKCFNSEIRNGTSIRHCQPVMNCRKCFVSEVAT